MKRVLSTLIAGVVALFATAQAGTVYNYTVANTKQMDQVGQVEYMSVSYDTDEKLSFKATLGKSMLEFGHFFDVLLNARGDLDEVVLCLEQVLECRVAALFL